MLSGNLLAKRLEHLNNKPLNEVIDIFFVFYKDSGIDVVGLPGDLNGLINNPAEMANTLLNSPEKILPPLSEAAGDNKKAKTELEKVVYCRTNPIQQNDIHLTVFYDSEHINEPYSLAILTKDGQYQEIQSDKRIQLLGK